MEIVDYIRYILASAKDFDRCEELLNEFGEEYRKAYNARRQREHRNPEVTHRASKKWYDTNKEEYRKIRNERNRKKAEEEWLAGKRTRKPYKRRIDEKTTVLVRKAGKRLLCKGKAGKKKGN